MNAAETSASSAIADCTPLTVVSRSSTTAEIDTFISDVSTTSTNIAIASRSASRADGRRLVGHATAASRTGANSSASHAGSAPMPSLCAHSRCRASPGETASSAAAASSSSQPS